MTGVLVKHKEQEWILGNKLSANGSPFQSEGPTTEKVQFCSVTVRAKRMMSMPRSVEQRESNDLVHSRSCSRGHEDRLG